MVRPHRARGLASVCEINHIIARPPVCVIVALADMRPNMEFCFAPTLKPNNETNLWGIQLVTSQMRRDVSSLNNTHLLVSYIFKKCFGTSRGWGGGDKKLLGSWSNIMFDSRSFFSEQKLHLDMYIRGVRARWVLIEF